VGVYFKECFRHPLFICFYISNTTLQMSNACMFCSIFYYRQYLHLSQQQMGTFNAVWVWINITMAIPLGWFVDKVHPMRATLVGMAVVIPMSFYGLYMESYVMWMIWIIIRAPFMQMLDASSGPLAVTIFPRKQYGQFASANATLRSCTNLVVNLLGAWFMGYLSERCMGPSGYRFLFLWLSIFQALAFGCMFVTYMYWKAHGAEKFSYDPEHPFSAKLPEKGEKELAGAAG
jgi:MFS family permease